MYAYVNRPDLRKGGYFRDGSYKPAQFKLKKWPKQDGQMNDFSQQMTKVGKAIFECLTGNKKKHWEAALEHQFAKNSTQ